MSKTLKKVGIVLGAAALIATGIGAVAGTGILLGGAFISASTIGTIAGVAAGIANVASGALAKKPSQQAAGSLSQILIATDAPRPYPMGETHFAGVLRHRTGYGGTVDGVENPYMFDVVVYSGVGPVESITAQIDFGAVPAWYTGFIATDTQLGAMPEASALAATFGVPTGWGAAYKLSGHAAIAWNYKFDKAGKKFAGGFPLTGALIEGVKVYDPRLDTTFPGGAGAHRLNDETTWEYSDNPALHAGVYAYGRYAEDVRVMGIGLPVEGVDFAAVAAWANVCETNGWTISGVAFEPGDRWANLKEICAAGSGEPVFAGAVLSFKYDAPVVALDTVTEADVLAGMAVTFMQSYRDRLNTIIPKYRSADHNWEIVAAEPVQSATYLTEDGEERREEWPFNFVKDLDQAAQLAAYKLVNSREFHPIKLTGMPRLRAYRPGDCLHLDLPRLGLDTDAVLLERRIDPATMTVELTFVGETDAKHAYALGLTGTAPSAPSLGQDAQEKDETAAGVAANPAITVADEAALIALEVVPGTIAKRTDNGISYSHNGGTSGTIADWTALGNVSSAPTSIVGITGTKAQFDTAVTDGNIVYTDAIGVTVQAFDTDLTTWAGVTPGTGVTTALAINVGSAGAFVTFNGAGGTPSSLTLTNATGLPTAGLVNDAVTFAKMQDIATAKVLGRFTAGSGDVEELSTTGTGNVVMSISPTLTGTVTAPVVNVSGLLTLSVANAQLRINGATSNRIYMEANGVGAPTFTTVSVGEKFTLYPNTDASHVNWAFGIEGNNMWISMPAVGTGQGLKYYGGTTNIATLRADGQFTTIMPIIPGSFTVANLPASGDAAIAFATNGRKVGEGVGAGTGVLVYRDGGTWFAASTDTAVAA